MRTAGAVLLFGLSGLLWHRYRRSRSGVLAIGLCLGLVAYQGAQTWGQKEGIPAVWVVASSANPALMWFLARSLFQDDAGKQPFTPKLVALVLALMVTIQVTSLLDFQRLALSGPLAKLLDALLPQLVSLVLLGWALGETQRGAKQDLLEPRRLLRTILMVLTAGYGVVVLLVELTTGGEQLPWQVELIHQCLIVGIVAIALFFIAKYGIILFPVYERVQPTAALVRYGHVQEPVCTEVSSASVTGTESDVVLRARLDSWISAQGFLEPALTITSLAERLETQEYRLRRLLNGALGFRNFNDFLHQQRIAEACARLRQAGAERLSILTLSIDLGYSSLATFNRAFKSVVGVSPSEYRRSRQFRN